MIHLEFDGDEPGPTPGRTVASLFEDDSVAKAQVVDEEGYLCLAFDVGDGNPPFVVRPARSWWSGDPGGPVPMRITPPDPVCRGMWSRPGA